MIQSSVPSLGKYKEGEGLKLLSIICNFIFELKRNRFLLVFVLSLICTTTVGVVMYMDTHMHSTVHVNYRAFP